MMQPGAAVEAIVIGAGPAGLTAALYLARYRRSVLVLHDGKSRALRIPRTHNVPGFPEGVEGPHLIARMSAHAEEYGARIEAAEISEIARVESGFRLRAADGRSFESRAVILATGIFLNQVDLPWEQHEAAIAAGVLRYCPICDGYEHRDCKIAVLGQDSNGAAEALFLRGYSTDITLMPLHHPELTDAQAAELADANIVVRKGALRALTPGKESIEILLEGDIAAEGYDVLYPALGCRPRAELAEQLGVATAECGSVVASALKDSGVPGFIAAGDVLEGLDQIAVAMGHGAQAATNIHNWLRDQDQHSLQAAD